MRDATLHAEINYTGAMPARPRFHANDKSLDRVALDPRTVPISDARTMRDPPSPAREGIGLFRHATRVNEFRDTSEVAHVYYPEIQQLIQELTGADAVVLAGQAVLRFGERSSEAGTRDNSYAARLVHIDSSDAAAENFARQSAPQGRSFRRV